MRSNESKEKRLTDWLRARAGSGGVAIGYSGGVDSTYLGAVAVEALGTDRVLAIIGRSPSYPDEQWQTAREAARRIGLTVVEIGTSELDDPRYAANPTNRCYFCKTELWSRLLPVARARGIDVVVDGTNADDLNDYRPGARAATEHGVLSPLAEVGLTKDEIRTHSRMRGLPTWEQPSSPCLSSRIPYGTPVTPERLQMIEAAERAVRALGLAGDLRVRHHGDLARVEIAASHLAAWLEPAAAARLTDAIRSAGFARVALDLRGFRSGSLNVLEGVSAA
jgi:pyridinium-3,5-biscarboxylic acid mononucleotide sulfurtransferase